MAINKRRIINEHRKGFLEDLNRGVNPRSLEDGVAIQATYLLPREIHLIATGLALALSDWKRGK